MLCHVDHRGARGSEVNTGDGAGILTALPHRFLERIAREEMHATLPDPGRFAAGLVFLPTRDDERAHCKSSLEALLAEQGQRVVGWREVPVDPDACDLGPTARAAQPRIELLIVAAAPGLEGDAFERQIYLARKRASHLLRGHSTLEQGKMFYVSSLSTKVIIYKGMLTASQLFPFFPDLSEPDYESHLAMIHSRFSTNTFPSWDRAQPNRFMAHNGEINTLRGNMNWMHARQGVVESDLFGAEIDKAFPVVEPDCSDSGTFDNVLEFLLMTGRTLQRSIMMMIPEAWQNDPQMTPEKRAFYEYHSCLLEPWDGPASIAFTDGRYIGAVLDRNGLRPSRYYLTTDDLVIMASEVGVLPIAPERVLHKGRLQPGRMFLVDFEQGRIIDDAELKAEFCGKRPYGQWLAEQKIELDELPRHPAPAAVRRPRAAAAPAGARLHGRDGGVHAARDRRGAARPGGLDGQRRRARDPLRSAAHALRLLPAALRAGHQPGDRLHPRRSRDVARVLHRPRAQPARDHARARASPARAAPDPHRRGAGRDQAPRLSRLEEPHHRHHLAARPKARPGWSGRSRASAPKPSRRSPTATRSRCCRIARWGPTGWRSARCSPAARCTTT